MKRRALDREQAQSFDRVAADYDRMGELNGRNLIGPWLVSQLPASGRRALDLGCGTGRHAVLLADRFQHVDAVDVSGPMVELARARRAGANISFWQADLHDVEGAGRYDFILSVLTLHHVPDLHAALSRIRALVAPGGRLALVDIYETSSDLRPPAALRIARSVLPLRPRLRLRAVLVLAANVIRRGPVTAREIYRLQTRREWLDHRVSDRFFSREELDRACADLLPGCRLDVIGGPRGVGLVWDAPAASRDQLAFPGLSASGEAPDEPLGSSPRARGDGEDEAYERARADTAGDRRDRVCPVGWPVAQFGP
jgi:ubiquinone/menaquinone biosynthesis C-methylase UbiE